THDLVDAAALDGCGGHDLLLTPKLLAVSDARGKGYGGMGSPARARSAWYPPPSLPHKGGGAVQWAERDGATHPIGTLPLAGRAGEGWRPPHAAQYVSHRCRICSPAASSCCVTCAPSRGVKVSRVLRPGNR